MKVLYIQHSGRAGGAPRSLRFLIDEVLKKTELKVTVMLLSKGAAESIIDNKKIKLIITKGMYPFHGSSVSSKGFRRGVKNIVTLMLTILAAQKYDFRNYSIVHLNSTCLCFYAPLIKMVNKDVKIFCHIREPVRKDIWGKIISKVCLKYVDYFFAISEYDKKSLGEISSRSTVVYNYVDPNEFRSNESIGELKKKHYGKLIVCYLARFDKKNGILDFFNLAKKFSHNKKIYFAAFGESGIESQEIKNKIETLTDNIEVFKMTENVKEVLNDIDILISPFTEPHFSRGVIEAASFGKPSIIYNVGSLNELVIDNKTGFIVDKGDVDGLYTAVVKMSSLEKRTELGVNARIRAIEEFSNKNADKIIDKYKEIY